jgi:ribonuclease J
VSGHASRPQQAEVIRTVRPTHFLPIHGELRHLHRHLELARTCGLPEDRLFLARDGDVLSFQEGRGLKSGRVPTGRIYRDRWGEGEVSPDAMVEREKLAEIGMIAAVLVIDPSRRVIVSGPHLTGLGLSREEREFLPKAAAQAQTILGEFSPVLFGDDAFVREELTRAIRRVFKQHTGKRPGVLPLVVKL